MSLKTILTTFAARVLGLTRAGGHAPVPAEPVPRLAQIALLAAAAAFVMPWEGLRTSAYLDRLAEPPVWTICYGETRGVGPGERRSAAQCEAQLLSALAAYHAALSDCLPGLVQQPAGVQVALTSWAYNVGPAAACGSTLVRRAQGGDWRAACGELARWNRAGGRVIAGLTARRLAEETLCRAALARES